MASTVDLVTDSVPDISGKDEKSFGQLNLKEKFTYIREVITVEPLIGAYTMASILCTPTIYKLESEKSCRSNLQMNNTVCDAILYGQYENYTDQIDDIQILISNMQSWQQPMQSIMPLILVLFLGSFSDRHKLRKPFLIIPLFGELFAVAGCIASVIFMTSWPLEVFGVFQLVIPSFFGGLPMITMAVFAYIADVSTLEMRTLRIGIVQIVLNIIVPLTHLFSAHMFELTGYYGVFLTAGALYIFGIIYGIYWIKEPKSPVLDTETGLLRDIFDPKHAIDTVCLVIKKSPGNNRLYIAFVLVIVFLYTSVVDGEGGIFYYYAQNVFGWDIVEYNYFMLINVLVHLAGIAIGVPFFTKVMHLTDTMILLITFLDKISSNFIFGFANTIALLYAGANMVPKVLTDDQKLRRVEVCQENSNMCESDPQFLNNVITGDESWIFEYDPETKRQSSEWHTPASPRPKKGRMSKSKVKTMLIVFIDIKGIVHHEFVPPGQTVNAKFYVEVLKRLKRRVNRVRQDIAADWKLHHDNAPAHTAFLVNSYLTKAGISTLPQPPYSPDVPPPPDFFCFLA
ncbi:uncharacterized protein LOC130446672 isoform X1 [Diorhabda sublineata]|uniref:uncharacterized protein LOC130446672 isoform X1 n=1 Tax=Diorhabda sublineata TaxID=1163346 RepID=UPI0024E065D0|nr:uncharacterized protein LOC130446672 isoform X1 [Diorhabda sublineata]